MKSKINPSSLLSSLWVFILLNMLFRDMHQFANKGFMQELLTIDVSEEILLIAGMVLEIPILMVVLSRVLKPKLNKWVNIVAAGITVLSMIGTLSSPDLDDIFFMIVESLAFVTIVIVARNLPGSSYRMTKERL